ncbi:hypothetical protein Tco_0716439 [Tanacetum coccineum]
MQQAVAAVLRADEAGMQLKEVALRRVSRTSTGNLHPPQQIHVLSPQHYQLKSRGGGPSTYTTRVRPEACQDCPSGGVSGPGRAMLAPPAAPSYRCSALKPLILFKFILLLIARRYGRTFNWQTSTFGKVKNYEDEDDHPIDFETEFLAIVFDNTLTAIQSEPTVCPPNENELDLRISLDESDDEDYTDLENEFPAIVYNDGLTSKSDLGIKPLINSECIDELNLISETSLSEYDKEIVLRFNDLFNDIYPDNLKLEKDDDDNDIGTIQSLKDNEITHGENGFLKQVTIKSLKLLKHEVLSLT